MPRKLTSSISYATARPKELNLSANRQFTDEGIGQALGKKVDAAHRCGTETPPKIKRSILRNLQIFHKIIGEQSR